MDRVSTVNILPAATATGDSLLMRMSGAKCTYVVNGEVASSTGASSITVLVSPDGTNFITLDTLSLTLGTVTTSDFGVFDQAWEYVKFNVASISGATATVRGYVSVEMIG